MSMAAAGERKKRCHYEVLGVSRDCSPEEIRSAYRKLALQLHPDKVAAQSPGGVITPAATAAFQDLLHAYETLSDPQARAYYDSHRSQLLFSEPNTSSTKKSSFFDLDLFSFFSPSAYSGFSDVGRGFYKVYGNVFGKIYEKEVFYLKEMGQSLDLIQPPPLLGNAESPYEQVSAFYGYWLAFCTVLDFGWVDTYDAAAGDNRRARRLMEEENKKLRKKSKKEYNENVRALAAFVKKKDKRVMAHAAKKKEEVEKKRLAEKERKKEEERRKMERARMYEDQEWAKVNEAEEYDDDGFLHDDGSSNSTSNKNRKKKVTNDVGGSELYCVICSKKFKSEKQWKNHEQSKKHKDKVAELREMILDDDVIGSDDDNNKEAASLGESQVEPCGSFDYAPNEANSNTLVDELCEEFENGLQSKVENDEPLNYEDMDEKMSHDDEAEFLEAMLSRHKSKKAVNLDQVDTSSSKPFHADSELENFMNNVKQECVIDLQVNKVSNIEEFMSHSVQGAGMKTRGDHSLGKNQKHKNQQYGKGAGKKNSDLLSRNSFKGKKQKGASKASGNECATCGESFDSRNKLFAHLGDTGHAMLKSR